MPTFQKKTCCVHLLSYDNRTQNAIVRKHCSEELWLQWLNIHFRQFKTEDADSMFLRIVGIYRQVYTAPKPKAPTTFANIFLEQLRLQRVNIRFRQYKGLGTLVRRRCESRMNLRSIKKERRLCRAGRGPHQKTHSLMDPSSITSHHASEHA
jgi:hypothetical protein